MFVAVTREGGDRRTGGKKERRERLLCLSVGVICGRILAAAFVGWVTF